MGHENAKIHWNLLNSDLVLSDLPLQPSTQTRTQQGRARQTITSQNSVLKHAKNTTLPLLLGPCTENTRQGGPFRDVLCLPSQNGFFDLQWGFAKLYLIQEAGLKWKVKPTNSQSLCSTIAQKSLGFQCANMREKTPLQITTLIPYQGTSAALTHTPAVRSPPQTSLSHKDHTNTAQSWNHS